jgi:hypothetical protein
METNMTHNRKAHWPCVASLFSLCVAATAAPAAPIRFAYEDVIDFSNVTGIVTGDAVRVTLTLDNGSTSQQSQVWTAADLSSVVFSFGSGASSTTFFSPFGGGLTNTFGFFATDSNGLLTSVPTRWSDFDSLSDFATNMAQVPEAWNLNSTGDGAPEAYFTSTAELTFANRTLIGNVASWSIVPQGIDAPAPLWLAGIGGPAMLLIGAFAKRGRIQAE